MPDAWVGELRTKVGYEINSSRHFCQYTRLRRLDEIEADLKRIEGEIVDMFVDMFAEVTE